MRERTGTEAELADALFAFFEERETMRRRMVERDPRGIEALIDGMIWTANGVIRAWNRGDE